MKFLQLAQRQNTLVSVAVVSLALLSLYLIGIRGMMKAAPFGDDFLVFYRAGNLFMNGQDPWLTLMTTSQPFSYPPHSLSIIAIYNLFSENTALALHAGVCILSIFVICYCANVWFLKIESLRSMTIAQVLALGLIIGNPYMATSLYQGQMTLPVTAALCLSWLLINRNRRVLAGVLLVVATLKPQLAILYILWLLLALEWRVLLIGGTLSLLAIVPAMSTLGFLTPATSWLTSLAAYAAIPINMPGSAYVVGLDSLFVAHGYQPNSVVLSVTSLLLTAGLFLLRKHISEFLVLQILIVLSFTFFFVHDYDYVATVLVWASALMLALNGNSLSRLSIWFAMSVIFFMPQRLIRDIDIPLIIHSRTLLLLAMLTLLVMWSAPVRRSMAAGLKPSTT